ncbi:ribonuclease H-like domain-containing protein [Tanacetum coccineum]
MELENTQNNALAKLPMLKLGEYEMWEIRIKQYFQIQDYALWEVIENGNSWIPIPVTAPESGPSTALKMTVPSTAEEKICKKNDVKARSLLLMALPNEHQLTFNQYVDAQSMFAAIKARFGGNEATKRTQKALLKQQSLPAEWDTHVVVWTNKPDFDTMGLDDLYNNFKIVEQKVKRSAGANNDDKNLAFLTTSGASSTNNINIVNPEVSTGTTKVNTANTEVSTASFSDATVYAFLSTQPQGSQLVHEDLEQLHDDDLEEMDLKWNMALLSMRARKFYQRTGRKIIIDGSSTAGYDKSKNEEIALLKRSVGHKEYLMGLLRTELEIGDTDDSLKTKLQKTDSSSVKSPLKVDKDWKEKFFSPANQVREVEPKKARENNDAPIIEDWVSDDEDDVEPISSCPNVYKHMAPRTLLMKTGLRPVNTVRSVNTGRTWMLKAHVWKNIAHLSDFKDFDGGYVTFGGGANRGRITGKVAVKHQILLKIPRQENMEKGIKREYSVARTPQQNGVAERKNRTLIEAARTMLADSKYDNILAEAVSTACYVQNRVYKELSASSLSSNGTADQQVNTVRPDINTGSREVSTALPEVNTATPKDLGGPSPASEDSQMEDSRN